MTDRETEEAMLHAELRELKIREHAIRDRLLTLAEMCGPVPAPGIPVMHAERFAVGRSVKVSDEGCSRLGQMGRIVSVVKDALLPIKVAFTDGAVIGYRDFELEGVAL